MKHGRWVLNDATYTETFPARGETDDYGVVAITDADFRYTYQDEEDTSVELRDEKIDARRFAPPPLPAGYHKVDYELWDQKDPADLNHEELEQLRRKNLSAAITNNLRHLAAAAEQHFMETGAKTATLSDLVGPDKYIRILPSHDGEDYSRLIINDRGGKWTVTTASGLVVSHEW